MRLKVDTSESRVCSKCGGAKPPLFRHHMGNDAFLAAYDKRIAFNYDKWLDCTDLCLDHHCEIHYLYETRLMRFWVDGTPNGAQRIRRKCIDLCRKWLAGKIRVPKIPKEYKEHFRASFEDFKRQGPRKTVAEWLSEGADVGT